MAQNVALLTRGAAANVAALDRALIALDIAAQPIALSGTLATTASLSFGQVFAFSGTTAITGSVAATGGIAATGERWYFEAPLEIAPIGGALSVAGAITITKPTQVDFSLAPSALALSALAGIAGDIAAPASITLDPAPLGLSGQIGLSGDIAAFVPVVFDVAGGVQITGYMGAASSVQYVLGGHSLSADAGIYGGLSVDADISYSTRPNMMYPLAGKRQPWPLTGKRQF